MRGCLTENPEKQKKALQRISFKDSINMYSAWSPWRYLWLTAYETDSIKQWCLNVTYIINRDHRWEDWDVYIVIFNACHRCHQVGFRWNPANSPESPSTQTPAATGWQGADPGPSSLRRKVPWSSLKCLQVHEHESPTIWKTNTHFARRKKKPLEAWLSDLPWHLRDKGC